MQILLALVLATAPQAAAAQAGPAAARRAGAGRVHLAGRDRRVLETGIVKSAVDQPIKGVDVRGGKAVVAMLHRDRAETGALIHERATETYYILHGSGTIVTGGRSARPSPPT